MTLLLRLLGTLLLLLAGMGGGFAAAARAENSRRQLHSFARLLTYLAELLDAQALTGPELLRRAAQDPAFAVFCPAPGESLSALTPPACMPDALRQEVQSSLSAAEEAPRLTACAALHRLASRCEAQSAEAAEHCRTARRLWPRLGGCLGALAAILLWKGGAPMDIDLVFKIAATGIIVAVLNQLLIRSGREDQAMMTTLAGLIVVLSMLVRQISDLFVLIKALFEL